MFFVFLQIDDPLTTEALILPTPSYQSKCAIQSKDALSALKRANTAECKQAIADTACKGQTDDLYPKHLPRFCMYRGRFSDNLTKFATVQVCIFYDR